MDEIRRFSGIEPRVRAGAPFGQGMNPGTK